MEINFKEYYEDIPSLEIQGIIERYFSDKNSLSSEETEKLKRHIIGVIERERIKVEKGGSYNFTSLISFVSLASKDEFDFSPVEKTLRVFGSIEKIYFLHTKESRERARKLREKLLEERYGVELIEVDTGNYDQVYHSLSKVIGDQKYGREVSRDEFLIENTLGMKMVSAAFSRFGIEQGIKLVTWQNEQLENKMGHLDRLPGSETLYLNKAPEMANYTSYNAIDRLLDSYDFFAAGKVFEAINNKEMSSIFEVLGEIFSYDNIDDYERLLEVIKGSGVLEFRCTNKKYSESLEKLKIFFKLLTEGKKDDECDLNNLMENYKKSSMKQDHWLTDKQKEKIYQYIYMDFVLKSYSQRYLADIIIRNKIEDEGWEMNPLEFTIDMDEWSFLEKLGIEGELESLVCELYAPHEMFKRNMGRGIDLFNGVLTIPERGINGIEIKNLKPNKKCEAVVEALLKAPLYEIRNSDEVFYKGEEVRIEEFIVPPHHSNPSKARRDFENIVEKTNEEIRRKTSELGKSIEKFINFDSISYEKGGKFYYKLSLEVE